MDYSDYVDEALIAKGDMYFNMKNYALAKGCYQQALNKLRRYTGDRTYAANRAQYLVSRIRACEGGKPFSFL